MLQSFELHVALCNCEDGSRFTIQVDLRCSQVGSLNEEFPLHAHRSRKSHLSAFK